jgi:hypothetical protein
MHGALEIKLKRFTFDEANTIYQGLSSSYGPYERRTNEFMKILLLQGVNNIEKV